MSTLALICFVSFVAGRLLMARFLVFSRRHLMDSPNERSSHHQPTPRGGGIVIAAIVPVAFFLLIMLPEQALLKTHLLLTLAFASLPLSLMGLIDDRLSLSPKIRLSFQSAFMVITILLVINDSALTPEWLHALLSQSLPLFFLVITLCMVFLTNLVNFMDGLDGLVASCFLLVSVAAALLSGQFVWLILSAPTVAFLTFNWPPAQLFLGDAGSTWMGLWIGLMIVLMPTPAAAFKLIALSAPLWFDASQTLVRRLISGASPTQPHRLHLYQRLHRAGWSHQRVTVTYLLAVLLNLLAACGPSPLFLWVSLVLTLLFGVILDRFVAVPFAIQESS